MLDFASETQCRAVIYLTFCHSIHRYISMSISHFCIHWDWNVSKYKFYHHYDWYTTNNCLCVYKISGAWLSTANISHPCICLTKSHECTISTELLWACLLHIILRFAGMMINKWSAKKNYEFGESVKTTKHNKVRITRKIPGMYCALLTLNISLGICAYLKHIEAETKWSPSSRRHFQMHFLEWK